MAKTGPEKAATDATIPPPLKALGGWLSADWFLPAIVSDDEVIGLALPELPGRRKQNFRIVERTPPDPPAGKRAKKAVVSADGPAARGILAVLDWIGATQMAAFRRTTLIFESKPVLYFAAIPPANLKARSSNRLRRALTESHFRGCIVHSEPAGMIAMFWPETEAEITGFVADAAPPYPTHPEFDEAEALHRAQEQDRRFSLTGRRPAAEPTPAKRVTDKERRQMQAEKQNLLQEIQSLRAQISKLQESQSALGAMEALGLDDARLKSMLRLLHPDKHANSEAANDAAKWVNNLRDLLKARGA